MRFRGRLRVTARLWWRMMRMQRVTREGWFYILFTIVVGAAAINTGNNLLHLVLGLQLSLILLSAFLSENALRGISVTRRLPRRGIAGEPFEVELSVRNAKRRLSSHSLLITEVDGDAAGAQLLIGRLPPGGELRSGYRVAVPRRGAARFDRLRITTRFPFGFFEKSREHALPAELSIHPAGVRVPPATALPSAGLGERPEPRPGQGAEFHALRDLRPDDDPRQVHWRSTARTGKPLVIERERERRRKVTLLVDSRRAERPEDLDGAAEAAFALARRFVREGCEVGLAWPGGSVEPGIGAQHLHRLGDVVAALEPSTSAAPPPRVHRGAQGVMVPIESPSRGDQPSPEVIRREEARPAGERGMSLQLAQRLGLLAASLSGFASLAISGELPTWASAIFIVSATLGLVMKEGAAKSFRVGANVLALGALAVLALQVFVGATSVIVAAPTFAVVLAASRLLGRRGPVDDALLLLAALLMLAGGAALTGELAYGLCFIAFAATGTVALCLTHLRREAELVGGPEAGRRRGVVGAALVSALAALSLAVLVGSALVFVLFPRVSAGMLHRAGPSHVAGGADKIQLGGLGVIKDDPSPVMRVHFPDGPPAGELYWRTFTFQAWNGAGWSRGDPHRFPVPGGNWIYLLARSEGPTLEAEIEWLGDGAALPTPGEPLELRFPRRPRTPPPLLLAGADGSLEIAGARESRYTVKAAVTPMERGFASVHGAELAPYLEVPEDLDPRIRALAQTFAGAGDPRDIAAAMVERLETELRYTRELPGEQDDPLAHFLFERREGHCEYFASALVMLLRLQGIPARVAAGFYGASYVEAGDYYLVRNGDAHAWTEAWIPGEGWARFDATPAAERPGTAEGLFARAVDALDLVRYWWSSRVLDFDRTTQRELAGSVKEAIASREGAGRRLTPLARYGLASLFMALAVVLAVRMRRRWIERRASRRGPGHRDAVRLYRAVKRLLRKKGVRLPRTATGAEWARAGAGALPDRAPAIRLAIEAYEAARFGKAGLSRDQLRALRRGLRGQG